MDEWTEYLKDLALEQLYFYWFLINSSQKVYTVFVAVVSILTFIAVTYVFARAWHWWTWGRFPKGKGARMSRRRKQVNRMFSDGITDLIEDLYFRKLITPDERRDKYRQFGINMNMPDLLPRGARPKEKMSVTRVWKSTRAPKRRLRDAEKLALQEKKKELLERKNANAPLIDGGPVKDIPGPKPGETVELPKVVVNPIDQMLAA